MWCLVRAWHPLPSWCLECCIPQGNEHFPLLANSANVSEATSTSFFIVEALPLSTIAEVNTSIRLHHSTLLNWRLSFQHINFGGDKNYSNHSNFCFLTDRVYSPVCFWKSFRFDLTLSLNMLCFISSGGLPTHFLWLSLPYAAPPEKLQTSYNLAINCLTFEPSSTKPLPSFFLPLGCI
jgi:hypothetical protein